MWAHIWLRGVFNSPMSPKFKFFGVRPPRRPAIWTALQIELERRVFAHDYDCFPQIPRSYHKGATRMQTYPGSNWRSTAS